ncbi:MBL fold metallo-hydrolase [Desulfovibrio inopinatus]|uniref:MBL fold metallo-hydrolase n=1 Tax=Desulfovibrio inopinatus TaxID=102109 RepID=UPI00040F49D8|nr:MBL fold metallo-hydrolase [Desulfovibrio inopinatus]
MNIIAIHHNCFIVNINNTSLLFDYPQSDFLPSGCHEILSQQLSGRRCIAFASHSHRDHFCPNLSTVLSSTNHATWIVSDDIADMYPEALPEHVIVMEPQQTYHGRDFDVTTLESNDLGVAFCITINGIRIYHGGDLAKWRWPKAPPNVDRAVRLGWNKALANIADFAPHIAFSNADTRVADFSGALDVIRIIQPDIFVPMHVFGNTSWINDLVSTLGETSTQIFSYTGCGDAMTYTPTEHP